MADDHAHALPNGYQLFEYRITRVLGHGGFGITYLAWDTNLEKDVAIKEYLPVEFAIRSGEVSVKPRSKSDEDDYQWGLERFLKEAQTLAVFRHPSIVSVYRFFEGHGTAYMVMEYEEGESFAQVMREKRGKFNEDELSAMLMPLLDGLAVVHKSGYLHRDIKPGNIYIREDGSPVLLDFGAARHAVGKKSQVLTSIVTPGYAPMEQYYSDGNQGPWTDIYALAGILYQAVTGKIPPEAPARIKNDPMVPITETKAKGFSPIFLAAIDRALAMDEEHRPQDVQEWRGMFDGTVEARTSVTSRVPPAGPRPGQTVVAGARPPRSPAGPSTVMAGGGTAAEGKKGVSPLVWAGAGVVGLLVVAAGIVGAVNPEMIFGETKTAGTAIGSTTIGSTGPGGDDNSGGTGTTGKAGTTGDDGEAERKRREAEAKRLEEERRRAEAEAKRREAEAKRLEEERRRAEAEAKQREEAARRKAEAEARARREREAARQREEEARRRQADAEEEQRRRFEDEERRRIAEEERRRREAQARREAEARRIAEEQRRVAEARRRAAEERRRRQQQALVTPRVRCPGSLPALNRAYEATDCPRVNFIFQRTLTDAAGPGVRSRWTNRANGHRGSLTVLGILRGANGEYCRRFRQTVTAKGRTYSGVGIACQYGRVWRIVRY